jgi:hypothetical protein
VESAELYHYEKYNFRVISPLLVLIALVFLFNSEYIGASIAFVLGALLLISYQGVIIDREGKRYLKYDRFLNFRIGSWQKMSTPSYVTIVRIKLSNRRTAPSPILAPEDKKGARSFKVNLVVEGKERYIPICHGPLDKMSAEALHLGKYLQIRVLDYTTHEKKWIL